MATLKKVAAHLETVRERRERSLCLLALLWCCFAGLGGLARHDETLDALTDNGRENISWQYELHETRERIERGGLVWADLDGVQVPLA